MSSKRAKKYEKFLFKLMKNKNISSYEPKNFCCFENYSDLKLLQLFTLSYDIYVREFLIKERRVKLKITVAQKNFNYKLEPYKNYGNNSIVKERKLYF
jgi:hypothetical protein